MHRFFVPAEGIEGNNVCLVGGIAHQITNVLRLLPREQVVLLDNSGREYVTVLTAIAKSSVLGEVVEVRDGQGEPQTKLVLYQSLLKNDKFEWVLQKGTELGVSAFVPMSSSRTIARDRGPGQDRQRARWGRIIQEAAEQSGRCLLPELSPHLAFQEACLACGEAGGLSLIPWEGERRCSIGEILAKEAPQARAAFIGPEGGWEPEEVEYARSCGITPVSLGKRILRAETAAITIAAAIMYSLGEMEL